MKISIVVFLVIEFIFVFHAQSNELKIQKGMTRVQVKKLLGTPSKVEEFEVSGDFAWEYTNGFCSDNLVCWVEFNGETKTVSGQRNLRTKYFDVGSW